VMSVVYEVASGAELAVLMLMVVPTHLLPQNGLVEYKLFDSVGEEAVFSVATISCFGIAATEF